MDEDKSNMSSNIEKSQNRTIEYQFQSILAETSINKNNKNYNDPYIQIVTVINNGYYRLDFSETMTDLKDLISRKDILNFLNTYKF